MRWAFTTIRLRLACRKISVSRTTGTAPESMMSPRTFPGPTEGSWFTSPTRMQAAASGTAAIRWCMSTVSTIEASSTTSRSHSSGSSSVRWNPPRWGLYSSSR